MKTILQTSILILVSTTVLSCSKPSSNDNSGSGTGGGTSIDITPKVKTKTTATETTTYKYDQNGKIMTEESTSDHRTIYTYTNGQVEKKFAHISNSFIDAVYVFYLNSDSLVKKIERTDTGNITEEEYSYNADKTVSSIIYSQSPSFYKSDFYYTDGNIDSIRTYNSSGNWAQTTIYTYYMDRPCKTTWVNFGIYFRGKESIKMIKSRHEKFPGILVRHYDMEYVFDSEGKIVSSKSTAIDGTISIQSYTYY